MSDGQTDPAQRLEQLQQKFKELSRLRIEAEQQVRRFDEEEKAAREEAEATFGVSDPEQLAQKRDEYERENREAVSAFENALAEAENALNQIDQQQTQ